MALRPLVCLIAISLVSCAAMKNTPAQERVIGHVEQCSRAVMAEVRVGQISRRGAVMDTLIIALFNLLIGLPALLGFGDPPKKETEKPPILEQPAQHEMEKPSKRTLDESR